VVKDGEIEVQKKVRREQKELKKQLVKEKLNAHHQPKKENQLADDKFIS